MPYTANYPASVLEVLREGKKYKGDTLRAMKKARRAHVWNGTPEHQQAVFAELHSDLCSIYGLQTQLCFALLNNQSSGSSYYIPVRNRIYLSGRLSMVTYLHEFAHARGMDERNACIWSVNLFRRIFPRSFERCTFEGHMVVSQRQGQADLEHSATS